MSLYSLDVIIDQKGKKHICEINGVCSGMNGFKRIYGDDRVKEEVFGILKGKHGLLTVNDGTFLRNELKREHPIAYLIGKLISKSKFIRNFVVKRNTILTSTNSETDWINEEVKNLEVLKFPFESYDGQESGVINVWNNELPHPTVNPFISEEISRNKFLQYMLLRDSEVSDYIIDSSLVGLGAVNEKKLERLLMEHDSFVVKPILGACGKGVKFIDKEEVKTKYLGSRGPIDFANFSKALLFSDKAASNLIYFEDLVDNDDFSFELGLFLVQLFIDSKKEISGERKYSTIRSVVCDGKFIDAYLRVNSDPKVNLSQNAYPLPFNFDNDFVKFCEDVVEVFEKETGKYESDSFKKVLYQRYVEDRGRTSGPERKSDVLNPILDSVYSFLGRNF